MRDHNHNPYEEQKHPGRVLLIALLLALVAVFAYLKRDDIVALFQQDEYEVVDRVEAVEEYIDETELWEEEEEGVEEGFVVADEDPDAVPGEVWETTQEAVPVVEAEPQPDTEPKPAQDPGPARMKVESFRGADGKVGFRNVSDGSVIIEPQYDRAVYRGTDPVWFVVVQKNRKYGIVSLANEVLLPFEYDQIQDIHRTEEYIQVFNTSPMKYGMVRTRDMQVVIPLEYDNMSIRWPFIAVSRGGMWGTVDVANREVVPLEHPAGGPGFTSSGGETTEVWFRNADGNIVSYDIRGNVVGVE